MAANDILTFGEAKAALAQDQLNSDDTEKINSIITSVSTRLDQVCGPIVTRNISVEKHDGGESIIYLRNRPVYTITSCTEYTGTTAQVLTAQSNSVQTTNNYLLDTKKGTLERMSNGYCDWFPQGKQNIEVVYVAGRYASTGTVSELFKEAASLFLVHVFKTSLGMGTQTFGDYETGPRTPTFSLPYAVLDMLGEEVQPGVIA